MARAAGTIAGLTRAEQPKCVLVQTWDDGVDLAALRSFLAITRVLLARMQAEIGAAHELLPEPQNEQLNVLGFIGPVVAAAIPAGLALWQLFTQKETAEKHFPVTIDSRALTLLVAGNLRRHGIEVLHPSTLAQAFSHLGRNTGARTPATPAGEIRRQADQLRDALGRISQRLGAKEPPPDGEKLAGVKAQLEATARVLSALDDALPGAGPQLFRGDEAEARLRDNGYVLSVQVLARHRTETNHMGPQDANTVAVRSSYSLADANGKIVSSDVLTEHRRTEETSDNIETWVDDGQ